MNIGFDAKRAFLNHTGLGNYSREVISALADTFPEETYYLYTTQAPYNGRTAPFFTRPNIRIETPGIPAVRTLWRSKLMVARLKRNRLDVFHGLSHEIPAGIPRTGIRSVVTMHDLIFLRYPQYYRWADRKIYELKYRYACRHADKIIAVSRQTKEDVQSFFGIGPDRIEVIYQGCDPSFSGKRTAEALSAIREKYHLPETFLLNVGTVEQRKNILLTVKALPMLPEAVKLVIIGRPTPYKNEVDACIKRYNLEERVIFLQNVPFEDLPAIYQLAAIFVYPSRFEGFGIPVLEALNSGVPVIAARGSCLEEAGGAGSFYVDPDDEQAMAGYIRNILDDTSLREEMIAKGYRHAAGFSSEIAARALMKVYRDLLT